MAKASVSFLISLLLLSLVGNSIASQRKLLEKKVAKVYEIKKGDFSIKVSNLGAVILSVVLPDSQGKLSDIVLGYEKFGQYANTTAYFGALVGRVANRIAGARFVLDGTPYRLYPNDGKNCLHGGHRGFNHNFWTVVQHIDGDSPFIKLYYHSFDGEQGFPGALDVYVTYKISADYELSVTMEATPLNKATPVNLAQGRQQATTPEPTQGPIFGSRITTTRRSTHSDRRVHLRSQGTPYDFQEPKGGGGRPAEGEGRLRHQLRAGFSGGERDEEGCGRRGLRGVGEGDGALGQPAGGSVLHWEFLEGRQGEERACLSSVRSPVFGDPRIS
ncbi:uncharacterized protein A4U43_C03F1160 [Asparagus officinalis]|uniref:Aldose 1-epimerase n=1 Tax=Asparagus officinalis TaxID=4686 RepID=A0A5P1FBC7_ASPOF|nr:uncharacterized protein A4U43_C03F1160 [Asparagus officinalis]